ncbi:hypothetical protein JZ751_006058 [Albula glossodonta]|uniref:Uncharacterized protein n=1 Tax=Albula glossodonta TaxID=121402 RepID=A0A8T2P794_9TELE|nr:hypothetical protein JZ751_006058 [Albula glossodonta]
MNPDVNDDAARTAVFNPLIPSRFREGKSPRNIPGGDGMLPRHSDATGPSQAAFLSCTFLPADFSKLHLSDSLHPQVTHVSSSHSGCSITSDSGSSSLSDIYQAVRDSGAQRSFSETKRTPPLEARDAAAQPVWCVWIVKRGLAGLNQAGEREAEEEEEEE